MPRPHPQLWKEISPYLDHALTLSAEQQRAWLASLRKENNDLAAHLEEFLAEHRVLDQQGFLEDSPMRGSSELELAGHSIGRYRLVSPIGRGGMSTVWLAERSDGRFERRVAIKFLGIALIGHGEERFRREGSLLGRLSHPNIAELLDAGLSAGSPYLVLEYIEGEPIDEYSNSGRLGVEARIRLFLNVLAAVAHAHANLVIHRDIKPSNVFVRKKDSEVKLLDFGIAKLLEVNQESGTLTVTRESGLTPAYAAPEQLNQGQITTTTDVYGLGVLLYLLLCGRHPAGPGPHSTIELVKAITEKEPERMSDAVTAESASQRSTTVDKLRRTLRGDLDTIVAKALKKDPRERYDSATAFAHDLNRYLQRKPIRARADTIAYRTAKFIRRNRIPVALGAISILTFIAGLIGTLIQAHTARTQRDFAFRQLARAEQLNQLTSFLLTDAAPSNAPITVNHLLGRAELIVNKEDYRNHPADHVELLISIGEQYLARGDTEQSKRILQQAYELSRKLEERAVRAQAACELAVPIDESGLHRQAEALIAEGLRDLPNDSAAVLDRVSCLTEASEVAVGGGLAKEAVSRSLAALAALDRSPVQSDNLRLTVLSDLAQAYNAAQRRELGHQRGRRPSARQHRRSHPSGPAQPDHPTVASGQQCCLAAGVYQHGV